MLQVSNLSKRYGDTLVFEGVHFTLNTGERVGLVGPNGSGKTTLLRILVGEERPDTGSVQRTAANVRIGYLPQALTYDEEATLRDVLAGSRLLDANQLADQIERLAEALSRADESEREALEKSYAATIERMQDAALYLPEYQVQAILAGLGLADLDPAAPVRILSGGQKTRLGLARLLVSNPSLLLLDEPTNHLDITALEWLEEYLSQYEGGMLIVSHDRAFLDRTVNQIYELDPLTHSLRAYPGNYSEYAQTKVREREKHAQMYHEQQERIARLQGAVHQLDSQARKIEKETIDFHYRKIAKKVARQATVRKKRIERMIESEDHLDKPQLTWDMKLEFVNTPPSGQDVLVIEDLAKSFGEHRLFAGVNQILQRGERIALLGPNGSGKTTLLRMITGQEAPTNGAIQLGANVHLGYFSQEQKSLNWELTPLETVQRTVSVGETEARSFLHYFLFAGDDVFVPVGQLSYGERARLALGVLVLQGCNLLLLDEPINHLDIPSREKFEQALSSYEGTVLAVVHDRYFVQHFATGIWAIEAETIRRYVDMEDMYRHRGKAWSLEP